MRWKIKYTVTKVYLYSLNVLFRYFFVTLISQIIAEIFRKNPFILRFAPSVGTGCSNSGIPTRGTVCHFVPSARKKFLLEDSY